MRPASVAALAALAALLLPPAAEACSVRTYTGQTFDPLEWVGEGRLRMERGGRQWAELDVASGTFTPVEARFTPEMPSSRPTPLPPNPMGGAHRLDPVEQPPSGIMLAMCGGNWPAPGLVTGYRLVHESGSVLAAWSSANETTPWSGAAWGNATHGFVWDHGVRELAVVAWQDGRVERTPLDLGNVSDLWVTPSEPKTHGNDLLLAGWRQVVVIDPDTRSARSVVPPFGAASTSGGAAQVVGDAVVFKHWLGERKIAVARVLLDGTVAWSVTADADQSVQTTHGLFVQNSTKSEVRVYDDGELVRTLPLPSDSHAVMVVSGDWAAIGFPAPSTRLVVYGPAMDVRYDASIGLEPSSVSTGPTDSTDPPDAGSERRGAPGPGLGLALAALAVGAALLRRR